MNNYKFQNNNNGFEINDISKQTDDYLESLKNEKPKQNSKNKIFILFLSLIFIFTAIVLFGYHNYKKGLESFDDKKVKVSIEAPLDVSSGEDITIIIRYKNETNVALNNVKVSLFVPERFNFLSSDKEFENEKAVINWKLGSLLANESGKIKVKGRIIGKLGSKYDFTSKISYVPENFNYNFDSFDDSSNITLEISSAPFEISIDYPKATVSGGKVEYIIDYKNVSGEDFENLLIYAKIPNGFEIESLKPKTDTKEKEYIIWNIGSIKKDSEGELIIKGIINGKKDEEKEIEISIRASLNKQEEAIEYIKQKVSTKIQEPSILINQTINGFEEYFADSGDELEYKIKFKNTSDKKIKGLVASCEINGNVDFDSIKVTNGSYNDNEHKIIWSAFNVPSLAVLDVGDEGEVSFKIKIKDKFKIENPDDKNFVVENKASINYVDFNNNSVKIGKEISSSKSVVKINANLFLSVKGYFNDDGRITNKGHIPPTVGKETNYTIHLILNDLFNDVSNIRIASILPENVKWTGNYIGPDGKLSLGNENNGAFSPNSYKNFENSDTDLKDSNVNSNMEETNEISDNQSEAKLNNENKDIGNIKNTENNQQNKTVPDKETKIEKEKFYYNPETREVVWEIPLLAANTGAISPAKEVVFQVSVTPSSSDIGSILDITNEFAAVGYDEFTGKRITALEDKITTELPDDYSIGIEEGIVMPF